MKGSSKTETKGFGSRLLDAAKRAVLEEEAEEAPTASAPAVATPATSVPAYNIPSVSAPVGTVDANMLAMVRQEVFNKVPSAWVRLTDVADKMKSAIPDETVRLKAAIPVANITLPELQNAVTLHQQALVGMRSKMADTVTRQRQQKVDAKQKQQEEIRHQIAELQAKLQALQQNDIQLATEIATDDARISQNQANFETTAQQVEQELATISSRITTLF